jgi:hypothetical protein
MDERGGPWRLTFNPPNANTAPQLKWAVRHEPVIVREQQLGGRNVKEKAFHLKLDTVRNTRLKQANKIIPKT